MGITPEEVKSIMRRQINSYYDYENTPHDGGPGISHERARIKMIIDTCKAVAVTFQAELERVAEIEDSHAVEEMKEWDAIDDSIEWEPTTYRFHVSNWTRSGIREFSSLDDLLDFVQASRSPCVISFNENGLYLHVMTEDILYEKED